MKRLFRRQTEKAGLPPGSLVYTGYKSVEKVKIKLIRYNESDYSEHDIENVGELESFKNTEGIKWVNITGLHQVDIFESFEKMFGIHPLTLEDVLNVNQRPKFDDYDNYLFVVLRMLSLKQETNEIDNEQLSLIITKEFVFTFQEKEGDVLDNLRNRIKNNKNRIRRLGTDYLAYSIIDTVIDHYFYLLEQIGEIIEALEEKMVKEPEDGNFEEIHKLKTNLILVRKSSWPVREMVDNILKSESELLSDVTYNYYRDVYDHVIQIIDIIETYREMVAAVMDIYLSSLSNRMNQVMKVLTIIATIFIPLTFIAGIYGMNFRYMPELEHPYGYPIVLFVMLVIGLFMLYYFRKKHWL